MTSSRHTYRRIQTAFRQLFPKQQMNGHQIRHLNTLIAMVCGIVIAQDSHLEKTARKVPEDNQVESRVKRFTRFNQNNSVSIEVFYLPFIMPLIETLATTGTLTLAMDASQTGRKCLTLMVSLIYQKRAIPLIWLTVKGSKGHLPEETHLSLLEEVTALIPEDCHVVFLGDGEFDGIHLQAAIVEVGWEYVCRTAHNRIIIDDGDRFALDDIALTKGEYIDMPDVGFTDQNYGPVLAIAWWHKDYDDPIYLVTNMECVEEACKWYRRRFIIETFFSDQKSRGFNLQKSHLSDPKRVQRFLMATCLAYVWMIYLGVLIKDNLDERRRFHRADRCDLSLFQLGLRYFEYLFIQGKDIPIGLVLEPSTSY